MAIQLLKFREYPNGTFGAVVWIDDSKSVGGSPDPAYLRDYTFPPVPQGVTKAAYLTQQKMETKRLIQAEIAELADTGTALPGEGQPL
jgi:hypothetical protein